MDISPAQQWESILASLWKKSRFTSYFYQAVRFAAEPSLPTLALSGASGRFTLYYGPDFVASRTDDELTGLLVHEMLHVALAHDHRGRGVADPSAANLAQDMVVNSFCRAAEKTFFSRRGQYEWDVPRLVLPPGLPMVPATFRADTGNDDPSWEDVYRWLLAKKSELRETSSGETMGISPFADAAFAPASAGERNSPGAAELSGLSATGVDGEFLPTGMHLFNLERSDGQAERRMRMIVETASADDLCREERAFEEVSAIIARVRSTGTDWRAELKSVIDFASQSLEFRYTASRLSRRHLAEGVYAPGRAFREKDTVTVAVDLSGSMVSDPARLETAFGAVEEMLGKYRVELVCVDEDVFTPRLEGESFVPLRGAARGWPYRKGDWRLIKSGARGATFFAPLFNRYMKGRREALVVITDGYVYDMASLKVHRPTVWAVPADRTEPFVPPFGRVVKLPGGSG